MVNIPSGMLDTATLYKHHANDATLFLRNDSAPTLIRRHNCIDVKSALYKCRRYIDVNETLYKRHNVALTLI